MHPAPRGCGLDDAAGPPPLALSTARSFACAPLIHGDAGADRIEALQARLERPATPMEAIQARVELAWELRMSRPGTVVELCEEASRIAQPERSDAEYTRAMAAALVARGFVDGYAGEFAAGVAKCLQAIALLEREPESPVRIRAWFTLGWTSFFLGDYPAAMENGLRALQLARTVGDRLHEAWVLDALASFHGVAGDVAQAIPLHEEALGHFRAIGEAPGILRTLNNLAVSLQQAGRLEEAFAAGEESVELAGRYGFPMDLANNAATVAHVLIELRRLEEAERYLDIALAGHVTTVHVHALHDRSRIQGLRGDPAGAEACMQEALATAERLGQRAEQATCHRALADLYEERGRYRRALAHFRRFHELDDAITGEKLARRFDVLRITYQLDAAQHTAESYRKQTAELETRVREQERVRVLLEYQSRSDPLTELHNRRHLDAVLAAEVARHARSGAPLSLIMLDVDHFKPYNDTYGHLRGDECLRQVADVVRAHVRRPDDVAARYGGEEFVCILPDTDLRGAVRVAEELRRGVMALRIPHDRSDAARVVTTSLGVITARCRPGESPELFLERADAQLYAAKSRGRNRTEAAELGPA